LSAETRLALVDDPRIVLTAEQRSDLLDESKSNTWLVEFLRRLLDEQEHTILVTALNSDHDPGTYHNDAGRAVDLWIADWQTVGDEEIVDVLVAAGKIAATSSPTLVEVGLAGPAAQFETWVTWPAGCDVFIEDAADHVHFAVGVPL
jgi:hypothetical protein